MKICLHHTALFNNGWNQLYSVNRYHRDKWEMKSSLNWYVGYNFFCDVNGKRTNTRIIGEETIAQKGHNCDIKKRCDTISYCMAGDFRYQFPTDKQKQDFIKFVDEMRLIYPKIKVVGHRDLQKGRTCPELPKAYIDQFNQSLDVIDTEKNIEIKRLQSRLDLLLELLHKLIRLLGLLK